ncbi:hypothetical protein GCM10020256_63470 [Streptomyces thermocoprophilus]
MVDAQQVVEDLGVASVVLLHLAEFLGLLVDDGLDAAGDADEGALRGVPQGLLELDEPQRGLDDFELCLGQRPEVWILQGELTQYLSRGVSLVHPVDGGGQMLLGEAPVLLLVAGDALFEVRRAPDVLGAGRPQQPASPHRLAGRREHEQRGDGPAQADGGPGRLRHQGDGGSGRRGRRYGGQQQHARVGEFAATRRDWTLTM